MRTKQVRFLKISRCYVFFRHRKRNSPDWRSINFSEQLIICRGRICFNPFETDWDKLSWRSHNGQDFVRTFLDAKEKIWIISGYSKTNLLCCVKTKTSQWTDKVHLYNVQPTLLGTIKKFIPNCQINLKFNNFMFISLRIVWQNQLEYL